MVTKEQVLTHKSFRQVHIMASSTNGEVLQPLTKPVNWRANGKCKTWKTRPDEFKLPIKHGLYVYGYITEENADLFEVAS